MTTAVEGMSGRPRRPVLRHAVEDVEARALRELELVREALELAVDAATRSDAESAQEVTARKEEFDRRHDEVHDELLALIARQTPVAGDLRLAMALLHVNDRIERMAAQCLNIATLCCALPEGARPSQGQIDCLVEMAKLATEQIDEAATAFASRDADAPRRLERHDARINEHNRRCFALAVDEAGNHERREAALFVAMMARAIERVGDNAVDIARQAAFVVTGLTRPA